MTKLRDDGCLETDEPVAAACFLGRSVKCAPSSDLTLEAVFSDGWQSDERAWDIGDNAYDYPILIPAKTVAEVWDDDLRVGSVLCEYGDFGRERLTAWLRTHTKETENE